MLPQKISYCSALEPAEHAGHALGDRQVPGRHANSQSWPSTDAQPSRLIVHCAHIANLRHAESTVAFAVLADLRTDLTANPFGRKPPLTPMQPIAIACQSATVEIQGTPAITTSPTSSASR